MPVAILEIVFKINNVAEIYYLKHFISFIIFLASSLVFFKILEKRFNNFIICFAGTILFLTTPRIFGDSFLYKDVLYLSFFTFTVYFFIKCFENPKVKNLVLFALFTALSINLRIFSILIPFIFIFLIFIKNFFKRKLAQDLLKILIYLIFLFIFLYIFWPYLWDNPFKNFYQLFISLDRDLIDVKILFNGNFISNRALPDTYILNWIMITSPIAQIVLFFFGFVYCLIRFTKRFLRINEKIIYNDLWRSDNEKLDVLFLLIFIFYYLFFYF